MNQIARVAVPNSPSVTGVSRTAKGGLSPVRMGNSEPIDALNPQPGISYNDAALAYEDDSRSSLGHKSRFSQASGGFNAPSQSFAAMFEGPYSGKSGATVSGTESKKFMNLLLPKAISIYEANARIISGTEKSIGSSLSLTL